jgi:hypothetical protein
VNVPPNAIFVITEAGAATTRAWREAMAASIDHVLQHGFRVTYGCAARCVADSAPAVMPAGSAAAVLVPLEATSDVPGAAGYHDDGAIHVFRDGVSDPALSIIASHEIFETWLDPGANQWADDGTGQEVAKEACDAVEAYSYVPPGCTAPVSDWVLPSFFDPGGAPPYSHLGKPPAPMTAASAGGADYQIVRTVDPSGGQQVTAALEGHPRQKAKAHPSSRTSRRGVRTGVRS